MESWGAPAGSPRAAAGLQTTQDTSLAVAAVVSTCQADLRVLAARRAPAISPGRQICY